MRNGAIFIPLSPKQQRKKDLKTSLPHLKLLLRQRKVMKKDTGNFSRMFCRTECSSAMKRFSGIAENADTYILVLNHLRIVRPACTLKPISNYCQIITSNDRRENYSRSDCKPSERQKIQ